MPNGIYPAPQFDSADPRRGQTRPAIAVRARTRWRRNRIDRELARGADPAASEELGVRATQLRSAPERARLANALVETLGNARQPNLGAFTRKEQRRHWAIQDRADDLHALVRRLRDDRPISIRGAAQASRLVNHRVSPLRGGNGQGVEHAIRNARMALDEAAPVTDDLAEAA
jgi:hypothetical protein